MLLIDSGFLRWYTVQHNLLDMGYYSLCRFRRLSSDACIVYCSSVVPSSEPPEEILSITPSPRRRHSLPRWQVRKTSMLSVNYTGIPLGVRCAAWRLRSALDSVKSLGAAPSGAESATNQGAGACLPVTQAPIGSSLDTLLRNRYQRQRLNMAEQYK